MNEEEIDNADLYQEKDDTNLVQDEDVCPCGRICMRCLGMTDRDFF